MYSLDINITPKTNMKEKIIISHEISKFRSLIMGLAMLSIMLFHQCFTNSFPFNLFHNFGYWGVDIFLFLSGMGLTKSLDNNSLKTFYLRRFNRIIPSCLLCGSIKYCIFLLLGSSVAILKDGLNIGIWSIMSLDLWFIPTIIILYTISPILYHLIKKKTLATTAVIILFFFINGVFIKPKVGYDWLSTLGIIAWTIERLPVFCAGMYISIRKDWIDRKIYYSFPFLFVAVVLGALEKTDITFREIQAFKFFMIMIGMPAIIYICLTILKKCSHMVIGVIDFFGLYSLELYLVHEFVFWCLKVNFNNENPFLLHVSSFIISWITAYGCKWVLGKVNTIIKSIQTRNI